MVPHTGPLKPTVHEMCCFHVNRFVIIMQANSFKWKWAQTELKHSIVFSFCWRMSITSFPMLHVTHCNLKFHVTESILNVLHDLSMYLLHSGGVSHAHTLRSSFPVLRSCSIISTMHSQWSHLPNYMYLVVENTWHLAMQHHVKTMKDAACDASASSFGRTQEAEESSN